ncbi:hypothetical protein Cgig2_028577 [Carnegiea gigantea]|uniref:Uncharacterized protein n=1 Tax=Carnegiea gigantea TaxID=171969 RepID=A0A9Q1QBS4_9CARY|nr:hypothetical protein Cgig2_028577 [Carnegiea gigantea]
MVDPRWGTMIGSPRPLPSQVTGLTRASRPSLPLLRHPMQLIPGEPSRSRSRKQEPAQPQLRDEKCSTEVMATIVGGYAEGITRSVWKAQLKGAQQEVNPTGMIRLLLCFGDKLKARNLKTNFLVVDVPTAYNIILGRPTLHRVKTLTGGSQLEKKKKRVTYWAPHYPYGPHFQESRPQHLGGLNPRPRPVGARRHNGGWPRSSHPPGSLEQVS